MQETILRSERFGRYKVRGIRDAHIWQEGKGVPKMEVRNRWGRRVGKRTPGGCKDGILQGMQKFTAPAATMDKTNVSTRKGSTWEGIKSQQRV